MWEDAYYSNESKLNETKYSTIGLKGAKNLSKNNNTREYKKLFNRQKQAEDIHNNSTDTLDNTNIKSKRETGWYKTKYGDWGTLITDKDAKLIKTLEPNKTYRLEEILKHDLLYQAYPMLKNLKVKTADISSSGAHSSIKWLPANNVTNTIFLNNNDISKKDYKNTLLHEINHFIEHKEKYNKMSRGANSKTETKDNYLNNLGEIISNETKINSNLTQDELNDIMLPEQAKSKPEYKNIREKLIKSNQKDTIVSVGGKNALQDLEISIQNEIKNNKVVDKKHNKYSRVNEDLGELDNSFFSFDNKGRKLTKAQQEYFKNSVVKDEKGNLKVVYHGTPFDFNKFSYDFVGANGTSLGKGFYLIDSLSMAKGFSKEGKEPMQLYVNVTNPMSLNEKTISKQQFKEYFSSASMALICSLSNLTLSSISFYIFKK